MRLVIGVVLWLSVAPFAGWAVIRVFGLEGGFPLVQLLAFTPYVTLASAVPLIASLVARRWWTAGAAAVVVAALGLCVVPRWLPDGDPAGGRPAGPTLRVLSANLMIGGGDPDAVVKLVRDLRVEVLAVQELTSDGLRALDDAGLAGPLPHRFAVPLAGASGSGLFSRYPLSDTASRHHPMSTLAQAEATVAVPGAAPVEVESVHPCAPGDRHHITCWKAELGGQTAATPNGPVRLLIGDFNATLDHALLRRVIDTGYRDAADVAGVGLTMSWPYDEKWYVPKVALDHILADRRVGIGTVSVHGIPGGDHRAIFAELVLPAG